MSWPIIRSANPVTILTAGSGSFAPRNGGLFSPVRPIITRGRNESVARCHPTMMISSNNALLSATLLAWIAALLRRFVRRLTNTAVGTSFWPTHVAEAIAEHVGPQEIAFFSGKLFGEALLQMRRLGGNEKFIDEPALKVFEEPEVNTKTHEREQIHRL